MSTDRNGNIISFLVNSVWPAEPHSHPRPRCQPGQIKYLKMGVSTLHMYEKIRVLFVSFFLIFPICPKYVISVPWRRWWSCKICVLFLIFSVNAPQSRLLVLQGESLTVGQLLWCFMSAGLAATVFLLHLRGLQEVTRGRSHNLATKWG